jgi:hypothetical protein
VTRTTIIVDVELQHITCAACGIVFAFPEHLMEQRQRDHREFYCPSGHTNYFPGESDVERLARELKEAKLEIKRAEYRAQTAQLEREAARKQVSATRGQMTKLKKRIANGVCPCCHRSFVNLQRHMTAKHPEYALEEGKP